jgi:5-methylcytosine-specific restriction endonuclease McrA
MSGSVGPRRQGIFNRDDWTCWLCGYQTPLLFRKMRYHSTTALVMPDGGYENPVPPERRMTVDHVVPKAHGGSDGAANLRTACKGCNKKRADQLPPGYRPGCCERHGYDRIQCRRERCRMRKAATPIGSA